MPDEKTKTGKQDDMRINVHQDHEVQDWSKKFGVTPDQLTAAVNTVGAMAKNVAQYLGKQLPLNDEAPPVRAGLRAQL